MLGGMRAMRDETRLYNCGGLPVELTLPEGEHNTHLVILEEKECWVPYWRVNPLYGQCGEPKFDRKT